MPRYNVKVRPNDGNAYSIMGAATAAMRRMGASKEELAEYRTDATSGDYDNLLRVTSEWVDLRPTEDEDEDENEEYVE